MNATITASALLKLVPQRVFVLCGKNAMRLEWNDQAKPDAFYALDSNNAHRLFDFCIKNGIQCRFESA